MEIQNGASVGIRHLILNREMFARDLLRKWGFVTHAHTHTLSLVFLTSSFSLLSSSLFS